MNKCGLDLECSNCVISVTCSIAALDTKEPALHIAQQGKHKICPRCGGRLSTDSGFDVCDDCGFDG